MPRFIINRGPHYANEGNITPRSHKAVCDVRGRWCCLERTWQNTVCCRAQMSLWSDFKASGTEGSDAATGLNRRVKVWHGSLSVVQHQALIAQKVYMAFNNQIY